MPASRDSDAGTSPISDRIRAEARRLGLAITALSQELGWDPSQLGTILRRLDAGGNVRADTVEKIAKYIGKTSHWILTGEEPGVRLCDLPGWAEASVVARDRMRISAEAITEISLWRVATPPGTIDAAFVAALGRAWEDARGGA